MTNKNTLSDWPIAKIFWGLLLVLLGGLALASNFGWIEVHFGNIWRLWPLMIVAAGLSILSLQNIYGRIAMIILALSTLGAVAWVVVGDYSTPLPNHTDQTTIQKTADTVKQAEISLKAGASSLQIGTAVQDSIVKSKLVSNNASVSKTSKIVNETQQISLTMDMTKGNGWFNSDVRNIWTVDLTRNLPLNLNLDIGASSVNIDVSEAMIRNINIKSGASSLTVKLGDKESITNLNIESGVSSVVIQVPKASGIQVILENGLTSNNLADLVKASENRYESSGYSQSKKQININTKIGLSSFTIERY